MEASTRAAAVLTLVALLPILAAHPADADPVRETRQVTAAAEPAWTVHWRAKTNELGGQFRLYRGADLETLEIVDIQAAAAGLGSYRYRDVPGELTWQYYQLRYVSSAGREVVLGLLRVDRVGLQHAPGTVVELSGFGAKALVEREPPWMASGARLPLPGDVTDHGSRRPEPEVPPPRGSA